MRDFFLFCLNVKKRGLIQVQFGLSWRDSFEKKVVRWWYLIAWWAYAFQRSETDAMRKYVPNNIRKCTHSSIHPFIQQHTHQRPTMPHSVTSAFFHIFFFIFAIYSLIKLWLLWVQRNKFEFFFFCISAFGSMWLGVACTLLQCMHNAHAQCLRQKKIT